jgi:hypothetical protein
LLVYISAHPDRQALYDWVLRTAVVPAVRPDARYPLVKDRSIGPTGAVGPGVIGLQPARHHPSAAPLVVWALPKLPGWATSTTLQAAPGPQAGAAGINRVMETKERASRIHTDLCVLESNVLRLAACWDGELDPIGAFCQLAYLHEKAGSPDAAARSIRASVELIAGWKDS